MQTLKRIFSQLINLGLDHTDSELQKLRQQSINIFNIFCIVTLIIISSRRINNAGFEQYVAINCLVLILFFLSLYFSKIKKLDIAVIIASVISIVVLTKMSFSETLFNGRLSPELGLTIAFFIILIKNKINRFVFLVICWIIIGAVTIKLIDNFTLAFSLIIEDIVFTLGFFFFVRMIERIDTLLVETIDRLEKSNKENIRLNDQLKSRNEELVTFSHVMTHDLKAPIKNIRAFSGLISKKVEFKDAAHQKYFSFIETSASNMHTLIDELLLFLKIDDDEIQLEEVDLNKVFDAVLSSFQYELMNQKIKINRKELHIVSGNFQLVKTVFHNLISNSIKYQPKDLDEHIPEITIRSVSTNDSFDVYLSDNGIGIKEEYIPNLFAPFKRFHSDSEYKGTGLGMSICRRAMEKQGGNVMLNKTSQKGTEFLLKFPKKRFTETKKIK